MSLITVFSAPKPFTDPFIATLQRNAIRSWIALGSEVEVILIGSDAGIAEAAAELNVKHAAEVRTNHLGTPLVSSMFDLARANSASPLLCCINADIILLPDYVRAADDLYKTGRPFLMVNQRWDLEVTEELDYSAGWAERLRERIDRQGKLHLPSGSDTFLFPRNCFTDLPPLTIGRAGWDNWMIYKGRRLGYPVVDATPSVRIVHQNHDYRHLPGGQPHYRLPETAENVRIGGGRRTIFTLADDADYTLANGQAKKKPLTWKRFAREVEIFPLIRLGCYPLAVLAYAVFHPRRFYGEVRGWLAYKLNRKKKQNA